LVDLGDINVAVRMIYLVVSGDINVAVRMIYLVVSGDMHVAARMIYLVVSGDMHVAYAVARDLSRPFQQFIQDNCQGFERQEQP
ncbi:MAG: hypothetical protein DDG59_08075, partial [Anaerolineae bacterium]